MTTQPLEEPNRREEAGARKWYRRENLVRFLRFGLVGALGVLVNWIFFELGCWLLDGFGERISYGFGVTLGIVVSIFTNFVLNDVWTWGDRSKRGGVNGWFRRMVKYYIGASVAAGVQFVVFWLSLDLLWGPLGFVFPPTHLPVLGVEVPEFPLGPRLSLLTGIVFGMAINFLAGHLWAFQEEEPT